MEESRIIKILFATDFLASSRLALDYAVAFARHFKATILMVHAVELPAAAIEAEAETHLPSVSRKHAGERLEAIAESVRKAGVPVQTILEQGIPWEVIPTAVESFAADLLVLGVYGVHRGLAHLLLGSNTEKILVASKCPTMTVGAHVLAGVDPQLHFKEILLFSEPTDEASAAAAYAQSLAHEFRAPLDVCQVRPPRKETKVQDSNSGFNEPAWFDSGREADQLIARAKAQQAGLIVLGIHPETWLERHIHTSFAYRLVAQATCPVISVPLRSLPTL